MQNYGLEQKKQEQRKQQIINKMTKLNLKESLNKILERTDLDDKVLEDLKEIRNKIESVESKLKTKIENVLEEPKSFIARLKETFGFWAVIEIGTILFILIPFLSGSFNIALGASLFWVLMHKFNKIWLK
jgi:Rad3-related DNA helicase